MVNSKLLHHLMPFLAF